MYLTLISLRVSSLIIISINYAATSQVSKRCQVVEYVHYLCRDSVAKDKINPPVYFLLAIYMFVYIVIPINVLIV